MHFDDVQYTRKDWRNRNRLKSPAGIKVVSVPVVKHKYAQTPINKIGVANSQPWAEKLLQQIRSWYEKANYFDACFPAFEKVVRQEFDLLVDLNYALNNTVRNFLGIETPQYLSSQIMGKSDDRNTKIIDICRHHGADVLYDGQSARNFIDLELFRRNGIRVAFQDYRHKKYPQLWGPFESHLSVLDLLLNCGPQARDYL